MVYHGLSWFSPLKLACCDLPCETHWRPTKAALRRVAVAISSKTSWAACRFSNFCCLKTSENYPKNSCSKNGDVSQKLLKTGDRSLNSKKIKNMMISPPGCVPFRANRSIFAPATSAARAPQWMSSAVPTYSSSHFALLLLYKMHWWNSFTLVGIYSCSSGWIQPDSC